ncbi:PREDICTED: RING finger protein B-like isoform X2 [Amphimedon queenslandica]|nr:PREDICTED: RING finger protein B-like isoform X2 [Amphimedon queenslandica]|eukprot:XP_019854401.1 PREDICTED: RING finger protein B-like isoform X2 [Amphimedon queenslandica]
MEWKLVTQTGDVPLGREGHSLNVVGDELFLLGGVESDNAATCAEGLYVFNTDTHNWVRREMTGDIPKAQSSKYVVTSDGKRIVTFGGVLNGHACNDTFVMDIETLEWKCIATSDMKPSSRCDYGCVVMDNKMYVFGGSGGESLWFNDLSYLDLDTYNWTLVESISLSPHPRDYPALVAISNQIEKLLIVFGGFSCLNEEDICLNDTHFLRCQLSNLSWNQFVSSDGIEPNGRYGHTAFVHENRLYVQGGQSSEVLFNDLWMVDIILPEVNFSPTVAPKRDYDTALPIPAPRKKLPPPTPTEINERSFEDLRSQYLTQINEMFDTLSEKFRELDEMSAKLDAERKQLDEEREELHSTYDRQQEELKQLHDRHQRSNEEWIQSLKQENDAERKAIAEEKARLEQEKKELESEKEKFNEKSNKLDAIMKQVQGLK